jgi:hypothetical protein
MDLNIIRLLLEEGRIKHIVIDFDGTLYRYNLSMLEPIGGFFLDRLPGLTALVAVPIVRGLRPNLAVFEFLSLCFMVPQIIATGRSAFLKKETIKWIGRYCGITRAIRMRKRFKDAKEFKKLLLERRVASLEDGQFVIFIDDNQILLKEIRKEKTFCTKVIALHPDDIARFYP